MTSFSPVLPSFQALSTGMPKTSPAVPNLLSSLAPKTTVSPFSAPGSTPNISAPAKPVINAPNFQPLNGPATFVPPSTPKPIIPNTTPAAYAKPNPSSAYVTTPSGAKVDAHTGALITPPPAGSPAVPTVGPTSVSPNTPVGNFADAGAQPLGSPALPDTSVTGSSTSGVGGTPGDVNSLDPNTNPLFSSPAYQAALAKVSQYSQMSPEEKALMDKQTNLNASTNSSIINAEGHGQDLPFVTGEQKNMLELGSTEGTRLAGLLTNQQAQRALNLQGATTQLTAAQGQLGGLQTRNAPITVPFGGTVVSKAGTTIGGGVFGNAGGTSGTGMMPTAGSPFDPSNTVDQYTQMYMQDPSSVSAKFAANPSAMGAIIQRANDISMQQTGKPFNASVASAGITSATSAITDLNGRLANSQSALPTIVANGKLILDGMNKAGINQASVPIINQMNQALKNKTGVSTGDIAAFNNSLTTLRNEYARLLMGKGQTTDKATGDADAAVPNDISPSQLAIVLDRIVSEGQNVITGLQGEIANQQKSISPYDFSGKTQPKTTLGTGSSSSSAPAGWNW